MLKVAIFMEDDNLQGILAGSFLIEVLILNRDYLDYIIDKISHIN